MSAFSTYVRNLTPVIVLRRQVFFTGTLGRWKFDPVFRQPTKYLSEVFAAAGVFGAEASEIVYDASVARLVFGYLLTLIGGFPPLRPK